MPKGEESMKDLTFEGYQQRMSSTVINPEQCLTLWYSGLGIAGEAGEVIEKIKKAYRDNNGIITPDLKLGLTKELGDLLWYMANTCLVLGISLAEVAHENIIKISRRMENNTIKGEGDDR